MHMFSLFFRKFPMLFCVLKKHEYSQMIVFRHGQNFFATLTNGKNCIFQISIRLFAVDRSFFLILMAPGPLTRGLVNKKMTSLVANAVDEHDRLNRSVRLIGA